MSTSELERERAYVSTLYARLDELQREAREQLDAVRRQDVGGNHQSRSERDAFASMYEDRIVQLRDVDERLAFGRLELAGYDEPEYRYIGRVGLRDAEQRPLLVDWRAPQASAFYQATAKTPLGTRARRHLLSKGRHVLRIEDEVFDADLLEDDRMALQGEGALLAALTTRRTGHMHDIVATIQAEQDRIIRSDPDGRARRAGRPGHRQDRRRAAPRRLPALLAPRAAEVVRRAHRRPVPLVPALHRSGAAVARRDPAWCSPASASSIPGWMRRTRMRRRSPH